MSFSTLISTAELAAHLGDPDWRVFDCRHQLSDVGYGEKAYANGHLPGAFFMHLDRDLSSPMTGRNGRHPLPDVNALASKLEGAGVSRKTQVVVYDDDGGMIAARMWWLLRWMGHDRVAVLDGSVKKWMQEERPLSTELPVSSPSVFDVELSDWVISAEEVLVNIEKRDFFLIDARAPDRFRGENETLDPVGGHIPGARNRSFRDNLDAQGCFRPAADLRREFLALFSGEAPERAVMQCGSGVTACHNALAMEIAGLPSGRLYAGSWSEWCSDPRRPISR